VRELDLVSLSLFLIIIFDHLYILRLGLLSSYIVVCVCVYIYITFLKKKKKEKRLHCVSNLPKSTRVMTSWDKQMGPNCNDYDQTWSVLWPLLLCRIFEYDKNKYVPPLNGKWSRQIEMNFFQTKKYIHALTIQASIMDRRVVFNRSFGEAGRRRIVFLYQAACMGGAACLTLVNICS